MSETNDNVIVRESVVEYLKNNNVKRRVCNESTNLNKKTKCQKIIHGFALPQISVKQEPENDVKEEKIVVNNEVVLVNGCWDISNNIPNIVAEMHNISSNDVFSLGESRDFLNPSPRGSDSGIEADCTEGNLSWLLNYKIHELPPVPDVNVLENGSCSMNNEDVIIRNNYNEFFEYPKVNGKCLKDDGNGRPHRYSGPKKPPFTYTELIEHALSEKGELTVSGIYQWISEHFPFYKQNDDRWKNSVRHNLSINPHFRKGGKAVHGSGHLWTIAQKDDKKSWQIKQRMQHFLETNKDNTQQDQDQEALDMELQAATASILGEFDKNGDGSNKSIEVEFINVIDVPNGLEDFLSPPVSKQQLVQECGLGNDFLITDLNPHTLGLNLEGEVVHEGNFYDDIHFEYCELEKE